MASKPQWTLERVQRLVTELRVAGVPAFVDSWEDELYLNVPLRFEDDEGLSRISVWWTGESWTVQSASFDGENTHGDAGHAPNTDEDLADATIVAMLLGAVVGNLIGADAYGGFTAENPPAMVAD